MANCKNIKELGDCCDGWLHLLRTWCQQMGKTLAENGTLLIFILCVKN